jgi:hypothetical protein
VAAARARERLCTRAADWAVLGGRSTWTLDIRMAHDSRITGPERRILRGLGLGPRIMLAVFAAVFAAVMFLTAEGPGRTFSYLFGGLCVVVTLACVLPGRARQFFGSVVGTLLFIAAGWYLYSEIRSGPIFPERPGEPSVLFAGLFALICGLPGIAYALTTRFGFRKDV